METRKKAITNGILFAITLVINTMGAIGLINGLSQKEISDRYLTLITPSPATFSIWSVIYSLLIIGVLVMIVKKNDPYYQRVVLEITGLFRLSSLLNILWIVTFSFLQVELALFFIFAFVITLSLINLKLLKLNDRRRWLLPMAFGLYGGWLFIATVVNTAAALVKQQWNGFGIAPELWAAVILVIAVFLVGAVALRLRSAIFPVPVAWAYFGIYQFLKAPQGFQGQYGMLEVVALAGMTLLLTLAVFILYQNRFSVFPLSPERR